jgi:hypothetical protein
MSHFDLDDYVDNSLYEDCDDELFETVFVGCDSTEENEENEDE